MTPEEKPALPETVADLKPAPYNPRTIGKSEAQQLRRFMREFGDLSGITFNHRTGNLIGAHQRIGNLPRNGKVEWSDAEHGTIRGLGHEWHVRGVDWDLEKEKRANVIANSPAAQGTWDQNKLAELLTEIDFEAVGFTVMDVEAAFSDDQIAAILKRPSVLDESQEPDEVKDAVAQLEDMGGTRRGNGLESEEPTAPGGFSDSLGSRARRRSRSQQPDAGYYRTLVFRSDKHAEEFMLAIGRPADQRYIDGATLFRLLKGEPDHGEETVQWRQGQAEGRQGQGEGQVGNRGEGAG